MYPADADRLPVDIEAFRQAMEAAGIGEIVDETLTLFVQEAQVLFTNLEESWKTGEADGARRAAHTLKASTANIRADELSKFMADIEHHAADGDLESVGSLMGSTRAEYASVMSHLAERGYGS